MRGPGTKQQLLYVCGCKGVLHDVHMMSWVEMEREETEKQKKNPYAPPFPLVPVQGQPFAQVPVRGQAIISR